MNCNRSSTSLNTRSAMRRSRWRADRLEALDRFADRQLTHLEQVLAADGDREDDGLRRGPLHAGHGTSRM